MDALVLIKTPGMQKREVSSSIRQSRWWRAAIVIYSFTVQHYTTLHSPEILFASAFHLVADGHDHFVINPMNSFNITVDSFTVVVLGKA